MSKLVKSKRELIINLDKKDLSEATNGCMIAPSEILIIQSSHPVPDAVNKTRSVTDRPYFSVFLNKSVDLDQPFTIKIDNLDNYEEVINDQK